MIATAIRKANLRHTLSERRREMQNELQGRIRNRRTDRPDEVGDDLEHSDADIQGDIEFAVLQMRAETLTRIHERSSGSTGARTVLFSSAPARFLTTLAVSLRSRPLAAGEERRRAGAGRARRLEQRRAPLALSMCGQF